MITLLSTKRNNVLGEKALDASLDALKNSTKKAERRKTSETLRKFGLPYTLEETDLTKAADLGSPDK